MGAVPPYLPKVLSIPHREEKSETKKKRQGASRTVGDGGATGGNGVKPRLDLDLVQSWYGLGTEKGKQEETEESAVDSL